MSATAVHAHPHADEDSQLGQARRIHLYARRPWDAFAITSSRERRKDALWIFALYFLVKAPVLVQRAAVRGQLDRLGLAGSVVALGIGLVLGVVLSWLLFLLVGALLHLLLNGALGAGRTFDDAVRLPILSLAPQLLLALEFPSLVFGFRDYDTFVVFTLLRVVVDVLSLRAFYWGLRSLFGLSNARALVVALAVATPVLLLAVAMLAK